MYVTVQYCVHIRKKKNLSDSSLWKMLISELLTNKWLLVPGLNGKHSFKKLKKYSLSGYHFRDEKPEVKWCVQGNTPRVRNSTHVHRVPALFIPLTQFSSYETACFCGLTDIGPKGHDTYRQPSFHMVAQDVKTVQAKITFGNLNDQWGLLHDLNKMLSKH